MDPDGNPCLIADCLIYIFTFLDEDDLVRASAVCKDWHEAAETAWLWRRICLQRWGFCNLGVLGSDHVENAWKKYFLRRSHLEMKMMKGRSGGDYTCKSLRGHRGRVVGLVYLQGNSAQHPDLWTKSAIVCSASTDGTIRAWDTQNGEVLWCSPMQSPLTQIISDEQHEVLITADSTGLIKTWQGQTGQEGASFSTGSPYCTIAQYSIDNAWFLSVGTSQGSVCTLAGSALTKKSSIVVCDAFKIDILLVSPDKKWIAAGTKDSNDLSPKVIYTESLVSPSEDEEPLCQSVPINKCRAAVFVPTQPARLALINHSQHTNNNALTIFDVSMKKTKYKTKIQVQQVESFPLTQKSSASQVLLEAKDSNCFLVAAEQELWVYSLKGALLASFKDHIMAISSVCVDSFRVVTASQDLSLRVLTWRNDRDHGLTLESRYHLLGGSHTMSRGFTHVACDYSSIVASVEGKDGKDVLKAYSFTS
ncbi:F-box/WD repeat-containing protein 12 [Thalassophryne amazonica]|uniref:F-box/WD repeat-containing protein 12 n=1 Tax=Thalassophryne amazonica TaxID=390379 RepID=UPI0014717A0B|nr:F-box/WD repeat-containing protein 12 [Thalassophryne amazonica]